MHNNDEPVKRGTDFASKRGYSKRVNEPNLRWMKDDRGELRGSRFTEESKK